MAHREKHRKAALVRRVEAGRVILSDLTPESLAKIDAKKVGRPKSKRAVVKRNRIAKGEPNEEYRAVEKMK